MAEIRLIDADALREDFKSRLAECNEWIEKAKDKETKIRASAVKAFIGEVIMTIDNAPTVENTINVYPSGNVIVQERPHGKWIYKCCFGDEFPQCSVCGEINDVKTNFCPDCGADMRGAE